MALSKETFRVMAAQAGFDPADPHLDELYPDVVAMFERIADLDKIDVSGVDPVLAFSPDADV